MEACTLYSILYMLIVKMFSLQETAVSLAGKAALVVSKTTTRHSTSNHRNSQYGLDKAVPGTATLSV